MEAFVIAPIGSITIIGSVVGSILEVQLLVSWTDEFVFVRVIAKILGSKLVFANGLGFAIMVSILVKAYYREKVKYLQYITKPISKRTL